MDVSRAIAHTQELLKQLGPSDAKRPELENVLLILVCYKRHDSWVDHHVGTTTSDDGGIW